MQKKQNTFFFFFFEVQYASKHSWYSAGPQSVRVSQAAAQAAEAAQQLTLLHMALTAYTACSQGQQRETQSLSEMEEDIPEVVC